MKTKAIIRIVVCTIMLLILSSILSGGLLLCRFLHGTPSGETTTVQRSVDAMNYQNIEIDWAAGSVLVTTGYTQDKIIIKETKDTNNHCAMSVSIDDNTLKISYGSPSVIHNNLTAKDLVILLPYNWSLNELQINGAALKIDVKCIRVEDLEINGAGNELTFDGSLGDLEAEGAGQKLNLTTGKGPRNVSVDGMGCSLNMTVPESFGFDVTMEGLGMSFQSGTDYAENGNNYTYGNEGCKIDVSGLGCKVSIDPS